VETTGGEGMSLAKGVQVSLNAIASSVKPGSTVDSATIGGSLRTRRITWGPSMSRRA